MSNEIKNLFNCEVFVRLDVTSPKNLCICDYDINTIYSDYDLIKVFDYFKYKDSLKLLHYIDLDNTLHIDGKKVCNLSLLEARKEIIKNSSDKANGHFRKFKDILFMEVKHVHSLNFEPSDKRIIKLNDKEYLNIYFQKKLIKSITPDLKAKFPYSEKLLRNQFGKDEYYEHFLDYLAYKIQFPNKQIPTHWVIIDDGGTGKTKFFANKILKTLFEVSIITQKDLESQQTHYIKNKQFVICEEIENFSNNKNLKALTGAESFTINEKYIQQYEVTNYTNFIIFSNDMKALHIDDRDRRWNIVGGGKRLYAFDGDWNNALFRSQAENKEFFKGFEQNLEKDLKSLYSYLLARPVDENNAFKLLKTDYKDSIIEMSKPSVDTFVEELFELGIDSFAESYLKRNAENFCQNNIHYNSSGENIGYWIKANELYRLYADFCNLTNHKSLQQNNFCQRIKSNKYYSKLFTENKVISISSKNVRCYKLKTFMDENKQTDLPEIEDLT